MFLTVSQKKIVKCASETFGDVVSENALFFCKSNYKKQEEKVNYLNIFIEIFSSIF